MRRLVAALPAERLADLLLRRPHTASTHTSTNTSTSPGDGGLHTVQHLPALLAPCTTNVISGGRWCGDGSAAQQLAVSSEDVVLSALNHWFTHQPFHRATHGGRCAGCRNAGARSAAAAAGAAAGAAVAPGFLVTAGVMERGDGVMEESSVDSMALVPDEEAAEAAAAEAAAVLLPWVRYDLLTDHFRAAVAPWLPGLCRIRCGEERGARCRAAPTRTQGCPCNPGWSGLIMRRASGACNLCIPLLLTLHHNSVCPTFIPPFARLVCPPGCTGSCSPQRPPPDRQLPAAAPPVSAAPGGRHSSPPW